MQLLRDISTCGASAGVLGPPASSPSIWRSLGRRGWLDCQRSAIAGLGGTVILILFGQRRRGLDVRHHLEPRLGDRTTAVRVPVVARRASGYWSLSYNRRIPSRSNISSSTSRRASGRNSGGSSSIAKRMASAALANRPYPTGEARLCLLLEGTDFTSLLVGNSSATMP